MSERDAVRLVSRALAALFIISACQNVIFMVNLALDHVHAQGYLGMPFLQQARGQIANLIFQLLVAFLFWQCGPGIAHFLLPTEERQQDSDQTT